MKRVRADQRKARWREFLRLVGRGDDLVVLAGEVPVARLVPYREEDKPLRVRHARGRFGDIDFPPPVRTDLDSLSLLLEDRSSRG